MTDADKGFNAAYKILKDNAEKLRNQQELDIDSLVPIVQESAAAYAICKERIAAVRAALAEHLKEETGLPEAGQ
ncbi:exodeoxyribonuclease VII small subunit [Noviherbaspirillum humi]|uniref:Exodeoxyribonuclease VII small subunit n=1 Tax=Noviherbaspirillum humi TaxID=1688639 RepID=A0A239M963_9BURK|nr:exodeoxyribonuclease VII small subunit [Noviherbaspirillum humi]SNT39497.1 exodeoxyribonuclease VII small subunit [Noviherbaspirillum humi]